jgi:putative hemolysin
MGGILERLCSLRHLDRRYRELPASRDAGEFLHNALGSLGIRYELTGAAELATHGNGPTVVVCNHPFGAAEGMLLAALLLRYRRDIRIMANHYLCRIPELRELFIPVDPFGGDAAARRNLAPLRDAVRWVRQGGMLVVFPAGEVAHFSLRAGCVTDPQWSPTIGRLVRMTRAAVIPFFIEGANSRLFQLAGLLHPRMRTLMLPREMLNKQGRLVCIRAGAVIPYDRLERRDSDSELIAYLRFRTYLLRETGRNAGNGTAGNGRQAKPSIGRPLAAAVAPADLARDIGALPANQLLLEQGSARVYFASARQLGSVMHEIGRLRELTFRAVGEGTGRPLDLDEYDERYLHLFIWDQASQQIAGAYRLGLVDSILARHGRKGLYTWSLFHYQPGFLQRISPAIELGRSFIRPEWQRNHTSLLLLWKGIGQFVVRHPHYRVLFGPVSISSAYNHLSVQAMIGYLREHKLPRDLAHLVRPRRRPRQARDGRVGDIVLPRPVEMHALCDIVGEIEGEARSIPVLLKQYLKLGGQVLGFNVDQDFGDCVDALLMVDLPSTPAKVLKRYMGAGAVPGYLARHAPQPEWRAA